MEKQWKESIAQVFDDISAGLKTGNFGRRVRVGLQVQGSEHGEEEIIRGAGLAQTRDASVEVVLIREDSLLAAQQRMDAMLESGEIDAAVAMHYSFPIGVSTVGRAVTPGFGRMMYIASTTGTSDTDRASALLKNAISACAVAKACGNGAPTLGILNIDGARQLERALLKLSGSGCSVCFAQSGREDGGAVMRGNDLLQGVPDIMVMDSLTGNVVMKMTSAFATGGNYEALGDGYGPGVGEGYTKIVGIISRASGAPVVAGALLYMAQCVKGDLIKCVDDAFAAAKKAGLDAILAGYAAENRKSAADGETVKAPPEKVVTEEIAGIEILELEDAVQVLWKRGLYASSGMGCTGPVIMVSQEDKESAVAALRDSGYL